jgi:hypothetical protein
VEVGKAHGSLRLYWQTVKVGCIGDNVCVCYTRNAGLGYDFQAASAVDVLNTRQSYLNREER